MLGISLVGLATAVDAADTAESVGTVTVRVYDCADLAVSDRQRALDRAAQILRRAGITLVPVYCTAVDTAACVSGLGPGDLILRLLGSSPDSAQTVSRMALGYAAFDANGLPDVMASVFTDRARRLSREARVDTSEVLGVVIAHELGHLLLGTTAHTDRGLMRVGYGPDELRLGFRRGAYWGTAWRFSQAQAHTMAAGLEARGAAASQTTAK